MAETHLRDLTDVVARVAERLRRLKTRELNEETTKTSFIEPVLEALGWDVRDFEEVSKEYRHSKDDNPVDYAFMVQGVPQFFLEAKGLGKSLDEPVPIRQVLNYANNAGVIWCVLSNGDEYRFYKSTEPVAAAKKMFGVVSISHDPPEHVARVLRLLAKAGIESDQLEEFWSWQAAARDVKAALDEMIPQADKRLVGLLAKRLRARSPKEIAGALRKLKVQIEAPKLPEIGEFGERRRRRREAGKQSGGGGSVSLRDLVEAGVLAAPVRLFCTYKKVTVEATVRGDGTVEFDGKEFDSCSAAGAAAKEKVTGDGKATNGWSFWCYRDTEGHERRLEEARAGFRRPGARTGSGAGA